MSIAKYPLGIVLLPVDSKINARNGVSISKTQTTEKKEGKKDLRTVKIGDYDAASKGMFPILETYRQYIRPAYNVLDGVIPITMLLVRWGIMMM